MFQIGQKVSCVDDDFSPGFAGRSGTTIHPNRLPFKGGVYEVIGIAEADEDGPEQIMLAEFSDIEPGQKSPVSFAPERFRPIVDTKTMIGFTTGAPRSSRKWDNRRKVKERVR